MEGYKNTFSGKRVLITGGLGFIGSNLAIRLVNSGADVTLVDNMMPRQGGNVFNVSEIAGRVHINFSDVRDELSTNYLVKDQSYIFHLAGQVNHVESVRDPIQDLDINCRGTLILLESFLMRLSDIQLKLMESEGVRSLVITLIRRSQAL